MKIILRFILIYVFIVSIISTFGDVKLLENEERLSVIENQIDGVVYLENIYHLSISLANYIVDADDSLEIDNKDKMGIKIEEYITKIYSLQEAKPSFIDSEFNTKLDRIKTLLVPKDEYFEFLDSLNHRNYEIGDKSELLFEADRKLHFLSALVTHYMPEYLISTLLSHNITEKYSHTNRISEEEKNQFIEQNKLIDLSISELSEIINHLSVYDETYILSKLLSNIANKRNKLQALIPSISRWKNNQNDVDKYIELTHEVLELSYRLSENTFTLLENNLKLKRNNLVDVMSNNKLMHIFVVIVLSFLIYFLYRSYSLNMKKDLEIQEIGKIVDKYVIFSKTDKDGLITYVSQALTKLSGFTQEEFIGKTHNILKSDMMEESVYKHLWDTITNKKVYIEDILNKKKDGSFYWVRLTIIPSLDAKGNITGYSAYRSNITNEKALELERKRTQEKADELLVANEALEKLSQLDTLTQIANRFSLDISMQNRYDIYLRHKKVFALILIDIDNFKSVNDIYGHLVGDEVLKEVSQLIKNNIRDTDIFGRWGGEEFMIICEETDCAGAYELAEKIRIVMENKGLATVGRKTISLGIAQIEDNITIMEFIKRADDALYYAKDNGKNRTVRYRASL